LNDLRCPTRPISALRVDERLELDRRLLHGIQHAHRIRHLDQVAVIKALAAQLLAIEDHVRHFKDLGQERGPAHATIVPARKYQVQSEEK
jgi:hypothetical protein